MLTLELNLSRPALSSFSLIVKFMEPRNSHPETVYPGLLQTIGSATIHQHHYKQHHQHDRYALGNHHHHHQLQLQQQQQHHELRSIRAEARKKACPRLSSSCTPCDAVIIHERDRGHSSRSSGQMFAPQINHHHSLVMFHASNPKVSDLIAENRWMWHVCGAQVLVSLIIVAHKVTEHISLRASI